MNKENLSTDSYKGVRDFYPNEMAIQRYIFSTWSKTAESFGFECYNASILEPSELYKSKGVENEEIVNEQTYTFIDRGEREVTLRPEMTPTVARMVAGRRRELKYPLRWYSIPNLFPSRIRGASFINSGRVPNTIAILTIHKFYKINTLRYPTRSQNDLLKNILCGTFLRNFFINDNRHPGL